jgi:hypothetical protein
MRLTHDSETGSFYLKLHNAKMAGRLRDAYRTVQTTFSSQFTR